MNSEFFPDFELCLEHLERKVAFIGTKVYAFIVLCVYRFAKHRVNIFHLYKILYSNFYSQYKFYSTKRRSLVPCMSLRINTRTNLVYFTTQ